MGAAAADATRSPVVKISGPGWWLEEKNRSRLHQADEGTAIKLSCQIAPKTTHWINKAKRYYIIQM